MRLSSLTAVAAAALAVGCSSSISSPAGNGSPSGDGGSGAESDGGGPGVGAGADGSAATSSDGGAQTDATPASIDSAPIGDSATSSDSAGGGGGSTKLYPLAVGYSWTYDVQPVGGGAVCASGTHVQQVTGTRTVDGRAAFDLTSFCAAAGTSEVAPVGTGDEVDLDYQASWLVMIDPSLVDGHTWTYFNSSYTWHRETTITVPAGTFGDCWTANQNVSYTAYMTYCRGAGMVRSYSQDLGGQGWDAKLTSKSF